MSVPYTFATATSPIPLSQLDSNFATAITLGNTAVYLGNTTTSIGNLTLTNLTISNVASTFPNSFLANSTTTLGNATLTLGGTTTSVGNLTVTNVTVTNYTETLYTANTSTAITVSLTNGTIQELTANASTTITLPSSVAGKSYTLIVYYTGSYTLTWAGGSTLKWASGTTPTATSTNAKYDIFNFYCDGTNTFGAVFGLNY
jgi:hypothetical protein